MTHRDFELIARVFAEHRAESVEVLRHEMCDALASSNVAFDRDRWLRAAANNETD